MMDEVLRVTALGEFIWHPEADRLIEEGDFSGSPSMPFILKALRRKQWQCLTTAETKALWNATKKPTEFADLLQAKLKEKNAADA
jgi:hypothetical protein